MVRIFRHYVPAQLVWLAGIEFLILFLSMYLGYTLRFVGGDANEFMVHGSIVPRAILFSLVMIITMTAFGMFTRESQTGNIGYYFRFLASFLVGSIAMTFVIYVMPYLYTGRGVLALALGFAFIGSAISRMLFIRLVDINKLKRRLLVVGAGSRAAKIGTLLEQNEEIGKKYHFLGYLVPGDVPQHPHVPQAKLIKDKGSLLAIVTRYAVDEIVTAIRERRNSGLNMHDLLECKLEGVRVTDISSFFERETGHVQLDSLNPSWMIYSDGFQQTSARNVIKRIFDVTISVLLLVLTLPITLITALLIVVESGSPVFYRQERVGECGQIFQVLKFRSMRKNAEQAGPQWATTNDNRVTRVGRVIRKLRIDELPQIINVLRGEMSFVGPRPERPYFVKQLSDQIPHFLNRHTVKPGITGWAQIRYPYGSSVEDAVQKLQFDLYYAKNHSLFLDLIILFQTVQVVLFGKGAR